MNLLINLSFYMPADDGSKPAISVQQLQISTVALSLPNPFCHLLSGFYMIQSSLQTATFPLRGTRLHFMHIRARPFLQCTFHTAGFEFEPLQAY